MLEIKSSISEDVYACLLKKEQTGIWEINTGSNRVMLSETAAEILSAEQTNLSTTEFFSLFENHSEYASLQEIVNTSISEKKEFSSLQTVSQKTSHPGHIIEISGIPHYQGHSFIGLCGTLKEIPSDQIGKKIENNVFSALYKNNPHSVFTVDKKCAILSLNAKCRSLFGGGKKGYKGKSVLEFIAEDYRASAQMLIEEAFKGDVNEREIEWPTHTDNIHVGNLSVIPVTIDGEIKYVHGFFVDTTENKKLQNLLLQEENLLDSIINNLPTLFFLFDTNGKFFRWNKNLEDVTEYSGDEVAKMHPVDFFDTDQVVPIAAAIKKVFTAGTATVESEVLTKTGKKIPYFFFATRIMFKGQVCLAGYGIDVTERKIAEINLKKSERRFKSLVQDGNDLIAIVDKKGYYKYVSPSAEPVLGFTPESFNGKNAFEFISGEDAKNLISILENLQPGQRVQTEPYRFTDANGNWRWLETVLTNMEHEPSIAGFVANTRDITTVKEQEERLIVSLEEKEVLLAEIHHRVKNNLAVISGMIEMQALEEENPHIVDKLMDSIFRIQAMANIHELLYQSATYSQLTFTEIIKKLIKGIQKALQGRKDIEVSYHTAEFDLNVNQAIPLSLILNEVITNIYKHAFTNKESGNIQIISESAGDRVSLEIQDDGTGLPADFDMKNTTSLGINIINILSRQLDADHSFTNREQGTSFKISFNRKNMRGAGNALITENIL